FCFFFFQAEDGIRDFHVTGVQTCALPILHLCICGKIKKIKKNLFLYNLLSFFYVYIIKELKLSVSVVSISEVSLIQQVIRKDRLAQKQLFDQFASKMLSTCRQYMKDLHEAEDVMLCAFMKVYQNIEQ